MTREFLMLVSHYLIQVIVATVMEKQVVDEEILRGRIEENQRLKELHNESTMSYPL